MGLARPQITHISAHPRAAVLKFPHLKLESKDHATSVLAVYDRVCSLGAWGDLVRRFSAG
jgi:hypothetical protein